MHASWSWRWLMQCMFGAHNPQPPLDDDDGDADDDKPTDWKVIIFYEWPVAQIINIKNINNQQNSYIWWWQKHAGQQKRDKKQAGSQSGGWFAWSREATTKNWIRWWMYASTRRWGQSLGFFLMQHYGGSKPGLLLFFRRIIWTFSLQILLPSSTDIDLIKDNFKCHARLYPSVPVAHFVEMPTRKICLIAGDHGRAMLRIESTHAKATRQTCHYACAQNCWSVCHPSCAAAARRPPNPGLTVNGAVQRFLLLQPIFWHRRSIMAKHRSARHTNALFDIGLALPCAATGLVSRHSGFVSVWLCSQLIATHTGTAAAVAAASVDVCNLIFQWSVTQLLFWTPKIYLKLMVSQ